MMLLDSTLVAVSPYATAAFGLAGTLIGGSIAGTVSLLVARQARDAAERAWVRDNRRELYDRFLTNAQKLLIACIEHRRELRRDGAGENEATAAAELAVEDAHVNFFEAYGVVQTVADRAVVDAARVYAYRLLALREGLSSRSGVGWKSFDKVARLVRLARHDTIDAMRTELGLTGSARPPEGFNPFRGTELEGQV